MKYRSKIRMSKNESSLPCFRETKFSHNKHMKQNGLATKL